MDKEIYFIRHGQTDYNKKGIVQGSGVDSNLNEVGLFQAEQFYNFYKDKIEFDLVIHSALKRTKQTVTPWFSNNLPIITEARINEMSWGDQEGKAGTPALGKMYKNMISSWSEGDYSVGMPNGESAAQLNQRMTAFVHDLKLRTEKKILVCSHGRAMRCLMCVLANQHLREMESYSISNVGLYKVDLAEGQFNIVSHNDTSHRTPLKKSLLE